MRGKRTMGLVAGLLLILTAMLLSGCGALATLPAESGTVRALSATGESEPPSISVSGTGRASAAPDMAIISLSVESVDEDADAAIHDNNVRTQAVIEAAKRLGVEEKDIQTTDYRLWIEERRDESGWVTGERRYHVTHSLTVRLYEIDKAGQLLGDLIAAGANDIDDIRFAIADPTALAEEARREAVANAKAKAETMAEALGIELGDVLYVSESGYEPPVYRDATMMLEAKEAEPVPVATGSFNVEVRVNILFGIKQ